MSTTFLDHIKAVEDHRVPGMTTYPLDEVLLTILVGLLCRMEDFDEIAMFGEEQLDWLRRFLPFRNGVAPAQTLRRVLRALDPKALAGAFSSWVASLRRRFPA
jgi:DDE_Tnp_1-associated